MGSKHWTNLQVKTLKEIRKGTDDVNKITAAMQAVRQGVTVGQIYNKLNHLKIGIRGKRKKHGKKEGKIYESGNHNLNEDLKFLNEREKDLIETWELAVYKSLRYQAQMLKEYDQKVRRAMGPSKGKYFQEEVAKLEEYSKMPYRDLVDRLAKDFPNKKKRTEMEEKLASYSKTQSETSSLSQIKESGLELQILAVTDSDDREQLRNNVYLLLPVLVSEVPGRMGDSLKPNSTPNPTREALTPLFLDCLIQAINPHGDATMVVENKPFGKDLVMYGYSDVSIARIQFEQVMQSLLKNQYKNVKVSVITDTKNHYPSLRQ